MDAKTFEALADENRLAIVRLLADGERCVCDVSDALGISGALASHHIKRLREAGLVNTRRRGTWLHCSLDVPAIRLLASGLSAVADRSPEVPSACCGLSLGDADDDKDVADV